jgi:hypothetical protein
LPDDPVEVNKDACSKQLVNLIDADAVLPGHTFDLGRLVGSVMVNVHPRMLLPSFHDKRDELAECVFFVCSVERP